MIDYTQLLIVIPAKLGSERVPRKNLRLCGGITLLERAIRFCDPLVEAGATVTVSTEAAECAKHAGERGVQAVVYAEPPTYHGPESLAADVWGHAWRTLEGIHGRQFAASLYLEPSSPQRRLEHVMTAIHALSSYDAAIAVEPVPEKYWSQRQWMREGTELFYAPGSSPSMPRQRRTPRYVVNGAVYARRRPRDWPIPPSNFPFPKVDVHAESGTYAVVTEPLINIDTEEDLEAANDFFG